MENVKYPSIDFDGQTDSQAVRQKLLDMNGPVAVVGFGADRVV